MFYRALLEDPEPPFIVVCPEHFKSFVKFNCLEITALRECTLSYFSERGWERYASEILALSESISLNHFQYWRQTDRFQCASPEALLSDELQPLG